MRRRRPLRSESGVSAVEFGLVLPLLLILVLGLIDYGYVYFVQLSITNAAREGARYGVTRGAAGGPITDCDVPAIQKAQDYLNTTPISGATITTDHPDPNTVQVTVTINPFTPLVGFLPPALLPNQLHSQSAMRWELAP